MGPPPSTEFDEGKAKETIEGFREFIDANKDEILALQIIYNQPYDKRHLTYEMIDKLSKAMKKPPYNLSTDLVWIAFEQLEKKKVKKSRPELMLADIISLVRYGLGKIDSLVTHNKLVDERFEKWLDNQQKVGKAFTPEQLEWLTMIKDHIATSMQITVDDFDSVPFYDKGGAMKVYNLFGDKFNTILEELNEVLAA